MRTQGQIAPRNKILLVPLVAIHNRHLDRHPVQVDHAPDLNGESAGRHPLIQPVDEVVQVPVRLPHHPDPIALRHFIQVKLAVLPAGPLPVGQYARARHHRGPIAQVGHGGREVE